MLLPLPPREVFWASCSSLHEGRRNQASAYSLPYTRHLAMPFRVTFSRPSQAERLMHCPLPRFTVAGLPRLIGTRKELAHLNPVLTSLNSICSRVSYTCTISLTTLSSVLLSSTSL